MRLHLIKTAMSHFQHKMMFIWNFIIKSNKASLQGSLYHHLFILIFFKQSSTENYKQKKKVTGAQTFTFYFLLPLYCIQLQKNTSWQMIASTLNVNAVLIVLLQEECSVCLASQPTFNLLCHSRVPVELRKHILWSWSARKTIKRENFQMVMGAVRGSPVELNVKRCSVKNMFLVLLFFFFIFLF